MAGPSQPTAVFSYAPVAYVPATSALPEELRGCGPYGGCVSEKVSGDPMFSYPNKEVAERFMAALRAGTLPVPAPKAAPKVAPSAETLTSKTERK